MKKIILIISTILFFSSLSSAQSVGIGSSSFTPLNMLDVKGPMVIGTGFAGINTAPADGLLIQGNVGIGTTNPGAKLNVVGNFYIDGDWTNDTEIRIREGGSADFGAFFKYGTGDLLTVGTRSSAIDYVAMQISRGSLNTIFNGYVGIGVSPSYKLDITGQERINAASGTAPIIISTAYAGGANIINLSADLLDGQHASAFSSTSHAHSYASITDIPIRTSWVGIHRGFVAEQLSWKNYGNNHTIFDASQGTSPDGTAVNNTNAQVPWSATYPTLMGWNGANTYGVRVDVARYAESAGSAPGDNLGNHTATTTLNMNGQAITNITESYNNSWYRNNNAGTGLYNQATGTGIYSPGGGIMAIYNNGSLGVGTTSPGGKLDVAGGALTLTNAYLDINRDNGPQNGISWYSQSYPSWSTYMSPVISGTGPHADLNAPSGIFVTSWAHRNYIEDGSGYGWTFESAANTTSPTVKFEIRSSDGLFHSYGNGIVDGSLGIGTTGPDTKLDVHGKSTFTRDGNNECCGSDATIAIAENTASSGRKASISFHNGGFHEGYIELAGSGTRRMIFRDNQGNNMGLDLSGAIVNNAASYGNSVKFDDGITVGDPFVNNYSSGSCNAGSASASDNDCNNPQINVTLNCAPGGATITNINFSTWGTYYGSDINGWCTSWFYYQFYAPWGWDYLGCNGTYDRADWNGYAVNGTAIWIRLVDNDGYCDYVDFFEQNVTVSYTYLSGTSPVYATYGQVRAQGTLYANSSSAYGDVAEFFKVTSKKREIEVGDIVSIDPTQAQSFILTSKANDNLIAGVISENPSIFINSPSEGKPVALTGRVKVKVCGENGIIKPGDPITSSSIEGVGMKASDNGTIVGYALEGFMGQEDKIGKVWILLDKGHFEKIKDKTAIIETEDVSLEGITTRGSIKIDTKCTSKRVEWSSDFSLKIPTEIEFDDLVIDIEPFGGKANVIVTSVDKTGFDIEVYDASTKFQGFYYNATIISPNISDNKSKAADKSTVSITSKTLLSDNALILYNRMKELISEMEQKTGIGYKPEEEKDINMRIYAKKKEIIMENWKKLQPALYIEYQEAKVKYDKLFNSDPDGISNLIHGNTPPINNNPVKGTY